MKKKRDMISLQDKVAIITHTSKQIGKMTAQAFSEAGAKVHLVDPDENTMQEIVKSCPGMVTYTTCEPNTEEGIKAFTAEVQKIYGRLDVLYMPRTILGKTRPIQDLSGNDFQEVWDHNVKAAFLSIKHAFPLMQDRGGSIIFTSGVLSQRSAPNVSAHTSSLHALSGLIKTAALEGAPYNIRVNSLNPSLVNSELTFDFEKAFSPDAPEKMRDALTKTIPLGRYAELEELLPLILFLASDQSSYITGAEYMIDGGLSAGS